MASSFLILRFVIPIPESTVLTGTAIDESGVSCGVMGDWDEEVHDSPFAGPSFAVGSVLSCQKLGCAEVAEFAGVVRNLPR